MIASNAQREEIWSRLQGPWDVIIVGGGITGAGILSEATARGLKALLVEQRDFAWGTSSRSSKLVHGGLRYLAQGHIRLVWESVREREQLLREGPGIVEPLNFLLANYRGDKPGRWSVALGLSIYDMIAGCWQHEGLNRAQLKQALPFLADENLTGGFRYHDATTDDARLVLRVLREAVHGGGTAINYAAAEEVVRENGAVVGVRVRDSAGGLGVVTCRARVVINATGAWADVLRRQVDAPDKVRPLRGSHLVFPASRLPLQEAVALLHPVDKRTLFVFPWEGASVIGTTDLDYSGSLQDEPAITPAEVAYLMTVAEQRFPSLKLTLDDVIASYCGVRPVINSGKAKPSDETRDHIVLGERGLVTVTGGKLTTFRLIARDTLEFIRRHVTDLPLQKREGRTLLQPVEETSLPAELSIAPAERRRLVGRHGADAPALVAAAGAAELEHMGSTAFSWAELRWAARQEWVVRLDDLMLRRVRVGLLLPDGGRDYLPRVRAICQRELGWSDARWQAEEDAYLDLWKRNYSLPPRASIPDWRAPAQPIRESA
jgi:glycerol-3-phosphate dehydrogenase